MTVLQEAAYTAIAAGRIAFREGLSKHDNPFEQWTVLYGYWNTGWDDAFDEEDEDTF